MIVRLYVIENTRGLPVRDGGPEDGNVHRYITKWIGPRDTGRSVAISLRPEQREMGERLGQVVRRPRNLETTPLT